MPPSLILLLLYPVPELCLGPSACFSNPHFSPFSPHQCHHSPSDNSVITLSASIAVGRVWSSCIIFRLPRKLFSTYHLQHYFLEMKSKHTLALVKTSYGFDHFTGWSQSSLGWPSKAGKPWPCLSSHNPLDFCAQNDQDLFLPLEFPMFSTDTESWHILSPL